MRIIVVGPPDSSSGLSRGALSFHKALTLISDAIQVQYLECERSIVSMARCFSSIKAMSKEDTYVVSFGINADVVCSALTIWSSAVLWIPFVRGNLAANYKSRFSPVLGWAIFYLHRFCLSRAKVFFALTDQDCRQFGGVRYGSSVLVNNIVDPSVLTKKNFGAPFKTQQTNVG